MQIALPKLSANYFRISSCANCILVKAVEAGDGYRELCSQESPRQTKPRKPIRKPVRDFGVFS